MALNPLNSSNMALKGLSAQCIGIYRDLRYLQRSLHLSAIYSLFLSLSVSLCVCLSVCHAVWREHFGISRISAGWMTRQPLNRAAATDSTLLRNHYNCAPTGSYLTPMDWCSACNYTRLLSTHADRHVVDISFTVFCVCVCVSARFLVTDISGVGGHRVMKFCRMVDLGVRQVISPFGVLWPRG